MRSCRRWRPRPVTGAERTPVGINLAGGAVALAGAGLVAGALPASLPGWRLVVVVATVGGFAAVTLDRAALAGVVLLGWSIANGFQENRGGELSWHGLPDIRLAMVLVLAAASGLAAGQARRQVRDLRAWRWAVEELSRTAATGGEKGEGHGA